MPPQGWTILMVERLAGHEYYCFLDGYSGYNEFPLETKDQEKRPHSPVLLGHSPTIACLLGYAMHLPLFSGA
jgi:hypothetical protein